MPCTICGTPGVNKTTCGDVIKHYLLGNQAPRTTSSRPVMVLRSDVALRHDLDVDTAHPEPLKPFTSAVYNVENNYGTLVNHADLLTEIRTVARSSPVITLSEVKSFNAAKQFMKIFNIDGWDFVWAQLQYDSAAILFDTTKMELHPPIPDKSDRSVSSGEHRYVATVFEQKNSGAYFLHHGVHWPRGKTVAKPSAQGLLQNVANVSNARRRTGLTPLSFVCATGDYNVPPEILRQQFTTPYNYCVGRHGERSDKGRRVIDNAVCSESHTVSVVKRGDIDRLTHTPIVATFDRK